MSQTLNLSEYIKNNEFSQLAEDGIVEKLFELIGINSGFLLECGAFDGVYLSNTRRHYLKNPNFKTLLIEPNPERFEELTKNVVQNENNILLNLYVEPTGKNSFNTLFERYIKENKIALLSIDVDGIDLELWQSIDTTRFRPAIVIIECGEWQNEEALNELVSVFEQKGYNLGYVTGNFIFVDKSYGITSTENIHQLIRKSGSPDFLHHFGTISEFQMNEYHKAMRRGVNIFTELCGEQIIEF